MAGAADGGAANVAVSATFDALGRDVAVAFLQWAKTNPEGVAALPTGRTPETFLRHLKHLLHTWRSSEETQSLLLKRAVDSPSPPDLSRIRFCQLDEYYPIHPKHPNTFRQYVQTHYIEAFGLDSSRSFFLDPAEMWTLGCDDPEYPNAGAVFEGEQPVDLSLRHRAPTTDRERAQKRCIAAVDAHAAHYERCIREAGGIGFFVGGLGPDGHVAFNIRGSDPHSTTRLLVPNYETMAAAAGDLGGMSVSRSCACVTIGLGTITYNPDATAIVMAAGHAKAAVCARAVMDDDHDVPCATLRRELPNFRFFLTASAASSLPSFALADFSAACRELGDGRAKHTGPPPEHVLRLLCDASVTTGTCVRMLTVAAVLGATSGRYVAASRDEADEGAGTALGAHYLATATLAARGEALGLATWTNAEWLSLVERADAALREKVERALNVPRGRRYLHTSPHHDDICLGYLPLVRHILASDDSSTHRFVYATSGFNAVTSDFARFALRLALRRLEVDADLRKLAARLTASPPLAAAVAPAADGIDSTGDWQQDDRASDAEAFITAHARKDQAGKEAALARRVVRLSCEELVPAHIGCEEGKMADAPEGWPQGARAAYRAIVAADAYYSRQLPGAKDEPLYQLFKGALREFEGDCLWTYAGCGAEAVHHLRLGFYKGERFTEDPASPDVAQVLAELRAANADTVTVALDPEGSGPDTHYRVLLAVAEALRLYLAEISPERAAAVRVIGYRNVWHRFHLAEAELVLPVMSDDLAVLDDAFTACFSSQVRAEFPCPFHDGPFNAVARLGLARQGRELSAALGPAPAPFPRSRAFAGACFARSLAPPSFFALARALRHGGWL